MDTRTSLIDKESLLARFGGDHDLLKDVAQVMLRTVPGHLGALRHAVAESDGAAIARAAHVIGGAVAYVDAAQCRALAGELETLGRSGDLAHVGPRLAELAHSLDRLQTELRHLAEIPEV